MKKDALYGPPKEIFAEKKKKKWVKKRDDSDVEIESSDDEYRLDEHDEGAKMAQLRKYEVNKMKYYYAVVFCNSKQTASDIIDEYNGMEFELTNIRLTLSCIDDDLEFPQELKEEVDEVPMDYKFDSSKISRALNHSTVKLSWDQTDPKRLQKL